MMKRLSTCFAKTCMMGTAAYRRFKITLVSSNWLK